MAESKLDVVKKRQVEGRKSSPWEMKRDQANYIALSNFVPPTFFKLERLEHIYMKQKSLKVKMYTIEKESKCY